MTPWTLNNREQLRDYLLKSKHALIHYLRGQIIEPDAPTFEESALQGREAKGQRHILKQIEELAANEPERPPMAEHIDVTKGIPK